MTQTQSALAERMPSTTAPPSPPTRWSGVRWIRRTSRSDSIASTADGVSSSESSTKMTSIRWCGTGRRGATCSIRSTSYGTLPSSFRGRDDYRQPWALWPGFTLGGDQRAGPVETGHEILARIHARFLRSPSRTGTPFRPPCLFARGGGRSRQPRRSANQGGHSEPTEHPISPGTASFLEATPGSESAYKITEFGKNCCEICDPRMRALAARLQTTCDWGLESVATGRRDR